MFLTFLTSISSLLLELASPKSSTTRCMYADNAVLSFFCLVDFGTNQKGICDFLLVINSNRGPVIVWPEAYCFCPVRPCVHPCVHTETLTRYLAEYLTHFHQAYINDALWDRDEPSQFGVKGSKIKVTVETALSGLVNMMS